MAWDKAPIIIVEGSMHIEACKMTYNDSEPSLERYLSGSLNNHIISHAFQQVIYIMIYYGLVA